MSNDYFKFKEFTVCQELCAMKVGTDATLLGAWAQAPTRNAIKILDIGTGTGIIALMMAQRFGDAHVTAIDIDESAVVQASRNVHASPFADRITVRLSSLQLFEGEKFDAVVCNPPYFIGSLTCPDEQRTLSRHTESLTYEELLHHAYALLNAGGEFSVICPVECLRDMEDVATIAGFFKKRECGVRTTSAKPPKRTMLSFAKEPQDDIEISEMTINGSAFRRMLEQFLITDFSSTAQP